MGVGRMATLFVSFPDLVADELLELASQNV